MSRIELFETIKDSLHNDTYYANQNSLICNDDSLKLLKLIPDNSISLIVTDPPYHSTKKGNIINDKSFSSDEEFVQWIELFSIEWRRILRPNGCGYMFCSSAMESKLDNMLSKRFNILSHIVWTKPNEPGHDGWKGKMKKEALRQWYPQSERIIFFEPADMGNLKRSYFGNWLKNKRTECRISGHELTELTGAYGKVNHGGAVSNWETGRNIPSKDQYALICDALYRKGVSEKLPDYEDIIRPFEANAQMNYTDVWDFPSVKAYKGKHPAEKPISLLEHCITSSSYEGDIILDCFAGSGSTLVAALKTNRLAIGMEIDPQWCTSIKSRLENCTDETLLKSSESSLFMRGTLNHVNNDRSLFD